MDLLDVNLKQPHSSISSFEKLLSQSALIADKLLNLLDAKSLALLGATSKKLRVLTNSNHLWFNILLIFSFDIINLILLINEKA